MILSSFQKEKVSYCLFGSGHPLIFDSPKGRFDCGDSFLGGAITSLHTGNHLVESKKSRVVRKLGIQGKAFAPGGTVLQAGLHNGKGMGSDFDEIPFLGGLVWRGKVNG